MRENLNLTEGNISSTLAKLALPIMGTAFIQMAYNLIDIMWLGRLSTNAVAAAGTAGYFMWFGEGLVMISQIGLGVCVAQSYGREEYIEAKEYVSNGIQLDLGIAILYSLILYIFSSQIIGFFNINSIEVYNMSVDYLKIIAIGMAFHFLNPVLSVILNSSGNSITPFKVNTIGLIINIVLDPLLIFGFGPIKGLGVEGAALATVLSQVIVFLIFFILGKRTDRLYSHIKLWKKPEFTYIKRIVKLGFPAFLQISAHSSISMILTRIIADFGAVPIAVQSVGSKIESISWMTSDGFAAAITAFMGQNYGAKKYDRIKEGYRKAMEIVGGIGIFATLLLVLGARPLFKIFIPNDPQAIEVGVNYLRILGVSQFFMSVEIGTVGSFNGLGRTLTPAVVGVSLNALRIPLAIFLSRYTALALDGIWWSISISSVLKGIILPVLFIRLLRNNFNYNNDMIY